MRVLLSTYGGRGDVEPLVALAVRLRERGATVRACAPPDRGERLAGAGVPVVPVGQPVRPLLHRARPAEAADVSRVAAGLIAAQFATLAEAAVGCDALVATGLLPAAAGARSVAEKLGIRYIYAAYCPIFLPSPHHPPVPFPGRPFPPGVTDNRVLWDLNDESANALFGAALNARRASIGLPPVDNVYDYAFTDWQTPADIDVTQTGAWIQPDERRLPAELVAFLDAGTPPVYVGFGSMPMRASTDIARVAIEAIRAQGRRAVISAGGAELAPIDDRGDCLGVGEVNHQALFPQVAAVVHHGGAGTTTTAARAGAPQVLAPQMADQPYWAGRVAELGIGTALAGPAPTTESHAAALRTAFSPATRARAAAVAGTVHTGGATVAAALLLDAAGRAT
ncbi:MAG: glycosyltransferase [Acidimicrobiales bacterium]